jgi:GAF domain-containing protein
MHPHGSVIWSPRMPGEDYFKDMDELEKLNRKPAGQDKRPATCGGCAWHYLFDVTDTISSKTSDFNTTLTTIIDVAIQMTNAERGFLVLLDEGGRRQFRVARTSDKRNLTQDEFKLSTTIVESVIRNGKPLFVPNVYEDEVLSKVSSVRDLRILSAMCAPIKMRTPGSDQHDNERRTFAYPFSDQLIGAIYVDSSRLSDMLSENQLHIFQSLASYAATALQNARLYTQAHPAFHATVLRAVHVRQHQARRGHAQPVVPAHGRRRPLQARQRHVRPRLR